MSAEHKRDRRDLDAQISRVEQLVESKAPFDYTARARTASEASRLCGKAAEIKRRGADSEAAKLHARAAEAFHRAVHNAYPTDFWPALARLREHDLRGLEAAVQFLEADPWFFRSGYIKEDVIRLLNRIDLPNRSAARLRVVVLRAVDGPDRREFRRYCRLARKVFNDDLEAELRRRLGSESEVIRRHARWVLEACSRRSPTVTGAQAE